MRLNDAVHNVTGEVFRDGWSRIRGSMQGLHVAKQRQLIRAAAGHRAAVFKAIRGGGTHTKSQLANQLDYLTTKSTHIVDSSGFLDGKTRLEPAEIRDLTDRFAKRWSAGFKPKLGQTTHMLLSFPIGTRGEDVRGHHLECRRAVLPDRRGALRLYHRGPRGPGASACPHRPEPPVPGGGVLLPRPRPPGFQLRRLPPHNGRGGRAVRGPAGSHPAARPGRPALPAPDPARFYAAKDEGRAPRAAAPGRRRPGARARRDRQHAATLPRARDGGLA